MWKEWPDGRVSHKFLVEAAECGGPTTPACKQTCKDHENQKPRNSCNTTNFGIRTTSLDSFYGCHSMTAWKATTAVSRLGKATRKPSTRRSAAVGKLRKTQVWVWFCCSCQKPQRKLHVVFGSIAPG